MNVYSAALDLTVASLPLRYLIASRVNEEIKRSVFH